MATPTTTLTPEQSMVALEALLNGPAAPPPAGVTPDFTDPANLHLVGTVVLILCLTLSTLAVLMRMYTKLFIIRSIAPEDYAVLLAWVGQIAEAIPSYLTLRYGASIHMWNVRLKDFFHLLYYINVAGILYCPAIFFVKLAILLQYLRIFVRVRRGNMIMFVGIHVTIWSCVICYVVSAVFLAAMCQPRKKIWNPMMPGHCFNSDANYQATAIFNVISDFTILFLPIPPLWKLQLPLKTRFGLMAVFATGVFACVTSVARVYYSWRLAGSSDISYNITGIGLWTWAEIAAGIIICCLPIFPRFFQHIAPKFAKLGTKLRVAPKHRSRSLDVTDTTRALKDEQSLGKHSEPYSSHGELRGEYITLDEYEKPSSEGVISESLAGQLNVVPASRSGGEV